MMVLFHNRCKVRWISLWPKMEGDEFNCSGYMHTQIRSLSDYAEGLKIAFVVFLFYIIENYKSELTQKMMSSNPHTSNDCTKVDGYTSSQTVPICNFQNRKITKVIYFIPSSLRVELHVPVSRAY